GQLVLVIRVRGLQEYVAGPEVDRAGGRGGAVVADGQFVSLGLLLRPELELARGRDADDRGRVVVVPARLDRQRHRVTLGRPDLERDLLPAAGQGDLDPQFVEAGVLDAVDTGDGPVVTDPLLPGGRPGLDVRDHGRDLRHAVVAVNEDEADAAQ